MPAQQRRRTQALLARLDEQVGAHIAQAEQRCGEVALDQGGIVGLQRKLAHVEVEDIAVEPQREDMPRTAEVVGADAPGAGYAVTGGPPAGDVAAFVTGSLDDPA